MLWQVLEEVWDFYFHNIVPMMMLLDLFWCEPQPYSQCDKWLLLALLLQLEKQICQIVAPSASCTTTIIHSITISRDMMSWQRVEH